MTFDKAERPQWDETFDLVLRQILPKLAPESSIDPDQELRSLGLDSLKTVELLLGLETAYGTTLFDELDYQNFATPRSLWTFVAPQIELDAESR
ncbi:acyl carrier protein [Kitasatospora sp. MAP12-15]|uniref:acyl carrier protein n=1 Tax=unclassified Kitasatospora TaxID=2633591 RepID=UPI0024759F74|nr:acyl carrier protein [Kitasatospora sp. MAP12-44]MDH6108215.1 acyl carrier protein [Kitasatospora sp. MAP12-44]